MSTTGCLEVYEFRSNQDITDPVAVVLVPNNEMSSGKALVFSLHGKVNASGGGQQCSDRTEAFISQK